jgi:hypothetical protein
MAHGTPWYAKASVSRARNAARGTSPPRPWRMPSIPRTLDSVAATERDYWDGSSVLRYSVTPDDSWARGRTPSRATCADCGKRHVTGNVKRDGSVNPKAKYGRCGKVEWLATYLTGLPAEPVRQSFRR